MSGFGYDFFKNLYGIYDLPASSFQKIDLTSQPNMVTGRGNSRNFVRVSQVINQLTKVCKSRKELLSTLNSMKNNVYAYIIIECLVNDAFNSMQDIDYFSVEYDPVKNSMPTLAKNIQNEIDDFVEEFNLCAVSRDIMFDFLLNGEYMLRFDFIEGKGIKKIYDDVDISEMMAAYDGLEVDSYLKYNPKTNKYIKYDRDNFAHFYLGTTKIRFDIETENEFTSTNQMIRVGRSVLAPVLSNLKKLDLLENISIASDLKKILSPNLVAVDIPPQTDSTLLPDMIDKLENYLNDLGRDIYNAENLSAEDLMAVSNRVKVVPRFTDGKGSMSQVSVDKDISDILNRINDTRKTIALGVGVPSFYIAYGDPLVEKRQTLKLYGRYSRKLVGIQQAFAAGIRSIIDIHLRRKGIYVDLSAIKVKFKSIVNTDNIDNLEVLVATISTIDDLFTALTRFAESQENDLQINSEAMLKYFKSFTSSYPLMSHILERYNGPKKEPQTSTPEDLTLSKDYKSQVGSYSSSSSAPTTSVGAPSPPNTVPSGGPPAGQATTASSQTAVKPQGSGVSFGDIIL